MEEKNQLPEGCVPIEYIEYRPQQERLFSYGRFERYKDALEYANHINAICKDIVCNISTWQILNDVVFCIIIPERVFDIVNDIRKEECNALNPSINVTYNTPVLYRFIEEKYVDSFMKTGKLKLTTFEKCKELKDSIRKDGKEGQSELFGYDGDYKIQIGFGVGGDAIMLSTSLCSKYKNDKGVVYTKFIEIFDVQGLLFAIAEQLNKSGYTVNQILFGPCFYTIKEFHKDVQSSVFREKMEKERVIDWDELSKLSNSIGGYDIYFQKPIDKRLENEFRLLWIVDDIKKDKDIFVTVPHPESYCRIIDTNNIY